MKDLKRFTKSNMRFFMAALVVATLVVAGCSGGAQINVDVDPETGEGSVDIVGGGGEAASSDGEPAGEDGGTSAQGNDVSVSDAVVFATVIALFLGVLAIVVSTANRRRYDE